MEVRENVDEGKQDQEETLKEILDSVNELIAETRASRQELRETEAELEKQRSEKKVSALTYNVELERIRRVHQDIDYNLRSLDRQRKIFLEKLSELN